MSSEGLIQIVLRWLLLIFALILVAWLMFGCAPKHVATNPPSVERPTYAYQVEKNGSVTVYVHGQGGLSQAKEEICTKRRGTCTIEPGGQIYFITFPEEKR